MGLSTRDVVSVVELAVFIPALIVSIVICVRHGLKRTSGWIYTLILCLIRIIGSCCELYAQKHPSTGIIRTTLIIDSIGLSPLLLATLGLLTRYVDFISMRTTTYFTRKHFRITQLLVTLGLILSVVGGTTGKKQPDGKGVIIPTTSKIGVILYIVAYVAIALICFVSLPQSSYVPPKERRVPLAVVIALPLLAARLLYTTLAVFVHSDMFNMFSGNIAVHVAMSVVEEFVVVAIYLLLGFAVDRLSSQEQVPSSKPYNRHQAQHQGPPVHPESGYPPQGNYSYGGQSRR